MQFAGQRSDINLKPIGSPTNILIKMTEDILPDPSAILITGITPQKTISEGISEAQFLKIFYGEIATPGTVFVGFNNVRFDDEFMRFLNYRNFYDPYEWQWKEGRAKWDLLDVVRMMRALRPDGIEWPVEDGKQVNRLELLAKANKVKHESAHDALSDVLALIELSQKVKNHQPKLFDYLFDVMTNKNKSAAIVGSGQPFVYTSGKYPNANSHTTVVSQVMKHPSSQASLVFDLRHNPEEYSDKTVDQLVQMWTSKEEELRLPIKTLKINRCPAVAPLGVLDKDSQTRLDINIDDVNSNFNKLQRVAKEFNNKLLQAIKVLDTEQNKRNKQGTHEVDALLYEGFFSDKDRNAMVVVHSGGSDELAKFDEKFKDPRLNSLLPLYKARNFPKTLNNEEIEKWDLFKKRRLLDGGENSRAANFFKELEESSKRQKNTKRDRYIIEELKLYAESILPLD